MPMVIVPIALAVGSSAAVAVITGAAIQTAIVTGLATGALSVAASLLAKQGINGTLGSGEPAPTANNSRSVAVAQALPPRRFLYGRTRAGGVEFFAKSASPLLYVGYIYSDGEIDGYETVYFGSAPCAITGAGAAATGTLWAGKMNVETVRGITTQVVSPFLAAAFPSIATPAWVQQGVARAVYKLNWGTDAANNAQLWGNTAIPAIVVRGVKVYDPRDVTQTLGVPTSYKYSTNPILCIAHAVTNAWGEAVPTSRIDWATVAAAASVCDTTTVYNAATYKIFELAGLFQAGVSIQTQVADMLNACLGSITFSDGKFKFFADGPRSAVWTIGDADIWQVRDYVHEQPQDGAANAILASFFDSETDGQSGTTPMFTLPTAIAAEGRHERSIDLKWTATRPSAQIVAYRTLQRLRAGRTCVLWTTDAGLFLDPNDVVTVSSTAFALANGTWEVTEIQPAAEGVFVHLSEYPTASYANPLTYLI